MKRYLISILIATLVLASGLLVGCAEKLQTFSKYDIAFTVSSDFKLEEYTVSIKDHIFQRGTASYEEGAVISSEKNFYFFWLTAPEFTQEEVRLSILTTADFFVSPQAEITGAITTQQIADFEVSFADMRFTLPGWEATGITAVWYSAASQRVMQLIVIHKQSKKEIERFIRSFSDSGTESPSPESTSEWGSHWDEALRLLLAGEFYSALLEYDKALELMPLDDSLIAFKAGINISKGEAYLMLFDGWEAHMCAQEAKWFLDQATEYEKQGIYWKLMTGQALLITTASLIYIPDNEGKYPYKKAKQLLESLVETIGLPEVHYFLGIVNDKLGNYGEAKSQFETFLSAPDDLVTFASKDSMRQRAQDWLTQANE